MDNLRGINSELISAFKRSSLYNLVKENPKEIVTCIRNNYIGLYHNADRIAKVTSKRNGELQCTINSYYLSDYHINQSNRKAGKEEIHSPEYIYQHFDKIKKNSAIRSTPEKKAQQTLVSLNNTNPNSEWICIDIEYKQSLNVQDKISEKVKGRFDIIAISKTKPHRIAIIELKFNDRSLSGNSGIVNHLKDFHRFNNKKCIYNLKKEIQVQLLNLSELDLLIDPPCINDIEKEFCRDIEFYIICLYDTMESPRGKVGGYLFNKKHSEWGTKRVSTKNAEKEIPEEFNILNSVKFLFRRVSSPTEIDIKEILNLENYEP